MAERCAALAKRAEFEFVENCGGLPSSVRVWGGGSWGRELVINTKVSASPAASPGRALSLVSITLLSPKAFTMSDTSVNGEPNQASCSPNSKRKASDAGLPAAGTRLHKSVKRRASKACQSCRARKVRCNVVEQSPCTNCRLDEVECIVSESKRKKLVPTKHCRSFNVPDINLFKEMDKGRRRGTCLGMLSHICLCHDAAPSGQLPGLSGPPAAFALLVDLP